MTDQYPPLPTSPDEVAEAVKQYRDGPPMPTVSSMRADAQATVDRWVRDNPAARPIPAVPVELIGQLDHMPPALRWMVLPWLISGWTAGVAHGRRER